MDRLIKSLGYEYLRTKAITMEDGGEGQIAKQRGFQTINPTDDWFPGEHPGFSPKSSRIYF
jgi:hypothetical protein